MCMVFLLVCVLALLGEPMFLVHVCVGRVFGWRSACRLAAD